jgi:hypothetical protein
VSSRRLAEADRVNSARLSRYRLRAGSAAELARQAESAMLPRLRGQPGFVAYEVIQVGEDELVAISTWRTRDDAERSAEAGALGPPAAELVDLRVGEVVFRHLPAET